MAVALYYGVIVLIKVHFLRGGMRQFRFELWPSASATPAVERNDCAVCGSVRRGHVSFVSRRDSRKRFSHLPIVYLGYGRSQASFRLPLLL